jgi:hypothetical protein
MAKKMIVDINGKDYEFALDRKEMVRGEGLGFRIDELASKPQTQVSLFWAIGLHKFQPTLRLDKAFDLIDVYMLEGGDVQEVIEFLSNEYQAFTQTTQVDTSKVKKARVVEEI